MKYPASRFLGLASLTASLLCSTALCGQDPLEVLFLGDRGHHKPAERSRQLIPYLLHRGIKVHYTESMADITPKNLARYDALIVIPIYQCLWIFFNIMGGAVAFDEFRTFSTCQMIFFPLGSLTTFVGIAILSRGHKQKDDALVEADHASGLEPHEVHQRAVQRRMSRMASVARGVVAVHHLKHHRTVRDFRF